ncbi:phage virion morphogenesis protein [Moraxella nasibovis]|uniref:phage virion morphogenesis protein n=1 Tax=Moraxella nasibovis TaxID=2904120 RepID=UPI0024101676|nr:phage virion morphogenesis protein [Moraxella nasibovis]WFF38040.1 phage virion morphogenesis protein [Moraxella nasibovis]
MAELSYLPEHLERIIDGLSDGQMLKLKKTLAQKVRNNQKKRITAQQNVDGSAYTPKKPQRKRRGQRVRKKMMNTIKQARHMKIEQSSEGFAIGYVGRMAQVAEVHQYGLTARINAKRGTSAAYPVRELLGISDEDKQIIDEAVLDYLEGLI